MITWQELHIQSNIPLIVLAVSLLCIAIIGFLEFKKISNRMNEITNEMNQLKSTMNSEVINHDNQLNKMSNGEKGKVRKKERNPEKKEGVSEPQHMDEMDMMKQMMIQEQGGSEIIMGGMMHPPNMMPGGIASMIIGGSMMPMGDINIPNIYEEDISGNHLDIEEGPPFKNSVHGDDNNLEEIMDDNLSECSLENEKIKDSENPDENEFSEESEESEESEDSESESESEEEEEEEEEEIDGIKLIQGKGKVEEVKEVKEVNRSLSIKELKDICQKMDLSTSGNKETLVKRINSKK
jgi:hypothetical protein